MAHLPVVVVKVYLKFKLHSFSVAEDSTTNSIHPFMYDMCAHNSHSLGYVPRGLSFSIPISHPSLHNSLQLIIFEAKKILKKLSSRLLFWNYFFSYLGLVGKLLSNLCNGGQGGHSSKSSPLSIDWNAWGKHSNKSGQNTRIEIIYSFLLVIEET